MVVHKVDRTHHHKAGIPAVDNPPVVDIHHTVLVRIPEEVLVGLGMVVVHQIFGLDSAGVGFEGVFGFDLVLEIHDRQLWIRTVVVVL